MPAIINSYNVVLDDMDEYRVGDKNYKRGSKKLVSDSRSIVGPAIKNKKQSNVNSKPLNTMRSLNNSG